MGFILSEVKIFCFFHKSQTLDEYSHQSIQSLEILEVRDTKCLYNKSELKMNCAFLANQSLNTQNLGREMKYAVDR